MTVRTHRRKFFWPALVVLTSVATLASIVTGSLAQMAFAGTNPTIASDQADYSPGSTVTLTGTGWDASEAVHLSVNDDVGNTWSWSEDVTADANGDVTDQLTLPTSFVATYKVTATGITSGAVTTT